MICYANSYEVSNSRLRGQDVETRVDPDARDMACAASKIGDRWTMLILWAAMGGATRTDDFQRQIGIERHTLSYRMKTLVADGVLTRRPASEDARWVEYQLTAKGHALRPALMALSGWGEHYEAVGVRALTSADPALEHNG